MRVMTALRHGLVSLHRREHGQVILLFLGITTVFFALAVVGVDASLWQSQRRTAQKDADAVALASAHDLLTRDPAAGPAAIQTPGTADAATWAQRNGIDSSYFKNGSPVIPPTTPTSGCFGKGPFDAPLPDSVTVDLGAKGTALFSKIYNVAAPDPGAHAKACIGSLIMTQGLRPWVMPQYGAVQSDGTCSDGSRLIGGDCVSNCFGKDSFGNIVPLFGAECKIRSDQPQTVGSVNLSTSGGTGIPCGGGSSSAAAYRTNIENGSPANCSIGDIITEKPGLATGPTTQGLQDLLSTEGACDSAFGSPANGIDDFGEVFTPADAIPGPNTVYTPRDCDGNLPGDIAGSPDSPRFVTVAVVNQVNPAGGPNQVQIISFAGFFIEKCQKIDNSGNVLPSPPDQEAKCTIGGSSFQIVGRFIQFQILGGDATALDPFGTKVIVLTQ